MGTGSNRRPAGTMAHMHDGMMARSRCHSHDHWHWPTDNAMGTDAIDGIGSGAVIDTGIGAVTGSGTVTVPGASAISDTNSAISTPCTPQSLVRPLALSLVLSQSPSICLSVSCLSLCPVSFSVPNAFFVTRHP